MKISSCLNLIVVSSCWLGLTLSAQTTPAWATPQAVTPSASADVLLPMAAETSARMEGQPAVDAPTHFGLRYAEFVEVNDAMTQVALEDPDIVAFSAQVEAMIAQREAMIQAAVAKKNPTLASKIATMKQAAGDLKRKRDDQNSQARALQRGQSVPPPAAPAK